MCCRVNPVSCASLLAVQTTFTSTNEMHDYYMSNLELINRPLNLTDVFIVRPYKIFPLFCSHR